MHRAGIILNYLPLQLRGGGRALPHLGFIQPTASTEFELPQWYAEWWAIVLWLLVITLVGYAIFYWRSQRYLKRALRLEEIVTERTRELALKNTALEKALADKDNALKALQATQRQLVIQEKMAALGTLTSSTAHDINTPLGVIRAASAHLEEMMPDLLRQLPVFLQSLGPEEMQAFAWLATDDRQQDFVPLSTREQRQIKHRIVEQLTAMGVPKAEDLVSNLLQCGVTDAGQLGPWPKLPRFEEVLRLASKVRQIRNNLGNISSSAEKTRKVIFNLSAITKEYNHTYREKVDVKAIIEQVLVSYSTYLKARIRVYTKWQDSIYVTANPEELQQVFTNIVFNAIQALGSEGRIMIEIRSEGNMAVAVFTDDGPGIPPEALGHLFEPFFTTKEKGEGSGLGLFISKKIVENHGGKIGVASEPGRTSFTVSIPLAEEELAVATPQPAEAKSL